MDCEPFVLELVLHDLKQLASLNKCISQNTIVPCNLFELTGEPTGHSEGLFINLAIFSVSETKF